MATFEGFLLKLEKYMGGLFLQAILDTVIMLVGTMLLAVFFGLMVGY